MKSLKRAIRKLEQKHSIKIKIMYNTGLSIKAKDSGMCIPNLFDLLKDPPEFILKVIKLWKNWS